MISVAVHQVITVDHGVDLLLAAVTEIGIKVSVQVGVVVVVRLVIRIGGAVIGDNAVVSDLHLKPEPVVLIHVPAAYEFVSICCHRRLCKYRRNGSDQDHKDC